MRLLAALALLSCVSASYAAPAPRPSAAVDAARSAFERLRSVCSSAAPLEPAEPPFRRSETRAFDAAQDRLRAVCDGLPALGGGLDAVKASLEKDDLDGVAARTAVLEESFSGFSDAWLAVAEAEAGDGYAAEAARALSRLAGASEKLYGALEGSVKSVLQRVTRQGAARPAAPLAKPQLGR